MSGNVNGMTSRGCGLEDEDVLRLDPIAEVDLVGMEKCKPVSKASCNFVLLMASKRIGSSQKAASMEMLKFSLLDKHNSASIKEKLKNYETQKILTC